MAQQKVLSVGIRSTTNLGDVAISDMIYRLLTERGYHVARMEFNFRALVADCFLFRSTKCPLGAGREPKRGAGAEDQEEGGGNRLVRVLGQACRLFFYLPIVVAVFVQKAKGCSRIFIGGGNLLMGIEHGFPLQVLTYVLLSRLLGKDVLFVCVGAGPLSATGVKPILRLALRFSQRVICRDHRSKELLAGELGLSRAVIEVLPDPVLLWPKMQREIACRYDILFTFAPLFSPTIFPDGDAFKAENFKVSMTDIVSGAIGLGKRVGILVTDSGIDMRISKEIVADVFARTGERLDVSVPGSPDEMAAVVSGASLVFSTRMHGAIMALSQSVPPLCVCWQPKIRGLYVDLGLADLLVGCDESGRCPTGDVLLMIENLDANRQSYAAAIEQSLSSLRERYDLLLAEL